MRKTLVKLICLIIPALTVLGLSACGGGGSSSGASGSAAYDSSLVVQVRDPARFAIIEGSFQPRFSLSSLVSNTLIQQALAQSAGIPVYIDGDLSATTDASGTAVIPVPAGDYRVCIGDLAAEHCAAVSVEPDSVVVVDGDTMTTSVERAQDHIVLFQDAAHTNKTLVCHKGQTISVGTPAAQKGHQVHGDSLGACSGSTNVASSDEDEVENEIETESEDDEQEADAKPKPEKNNNGNKGPSDEKRPRA